MKMKRGCLLSGVLIFCLMVPFAAHAAAPESAAKDAVAAPVARTDAGNAPAGINEKNETGPVSAGVKEDAGVSAEAPPAAEEEQSDMADPIEPLNRIFFTFNDKLYFWVLKPTAKVYSVVVPQWGRVRVRNAFHNIAMPIRFVSSLLQLDFKTAGYELGSFVMNSTWGVGGMFEIVKKTPDIRTDQDLGLTFGHYGVREGFYIVWPIVGPSCLRDSVGLAGDSFLYPVNYITPLENWFEVRAGERVNDTSLKIGDYEDLKASALDPYLAVRDAYKQYRRSQIKGEAATAPATP